MKTRAQLLDELHQLENQLCDLEERFGDLSTHPNVDQSSLTWIENRIHEIAKELKNDQSDNRHLEDSRNS